MVEIKKDSRGRPLKYNDLDINLVKVLPLRGSSIRKLRNRYRLRQRDFAKLLGINHKELSCLETDVYFPSSPVLLLLTLIREKGIEIFSQ